MPRTNISNPFADEVANLGPEGFMGMLGMVMGGMSMQTGLPGSSPPWMRYGAGTLGSALDSQLESARRNPYYGGSSSNAFMSQATPFGNTFVGGLAQSAILDKLPKMFGFGSSLGMHQIQFGDHTPYTGSSYDFSRGIQNQWMLTQMQKGGEGFQRVSSYETGMDKLSLTGVDPVDNVLKNFIGLDSIRANRVGQAGLAWQMPGRSPKDRAFEVQNIMKGIADTGSSGGFWDQRKFAGGTMEDVVGGVSMASLYGMEGFSTREIRDMSGVGGHPRRHERDLRATGQIMAAGKGILGADATPSQVFGLVGDIMGSDPNMTAGQAQDRLRKVQQLSEMVNIDAKVLVNYAAAMRQLTKTLGMVGGSGASAANQMMETTAYTLATSREQGVNITAEQAGSITRRAVSATAQSAPIKAMDAMSIAISPFSERQLSGMKIKGVKGVSSMADVKGLLDIVRNVDPNDPESIKRAQRAEMVLQSHMPEIMRQLPKGKAGDLMRYQISKFFSTQDPEERERMLSRAGVHSLSDLGAKGVDVNIVEALRRNKKEGQFIDSYGKLTGLAPVLTAAAAGEDVGKALDTFLQSDRGKEYAKQYGLEGMDIEDQKAMLHLNLVNMNRQWGEQGGFASMAVAAGADDRKKAALKGQKGMIERMVIEAATTGTGKGLTDPENARRFISEILKDKGANSKDLQDFLVKKGIAHRDKSGKIELESGEKIVEALKGGADFGEIFDMLGESSAKAFSKVYGMTGAKIYERLGKGEALGSYKGEKMNVEEFTKRAFGEKDADKRRAMVSDYVDSIFQNEEFEGVDKDELDKIKTKLKKRLDEIKKLAPKKKKDPSAPDPDPGGGGGGGSGKPDPKNAAVEKALEIIGKIVEKLDEISKKMGPGKGEGGPPKPGTAKGIEAETT